VTKQICSKYRGVLRRKKHRQRKIDLPNRADTVPIKRLDTARILFDCPTCSREVAAVSYAPHLTYAVFCPICGTKYIALKDTRRMEDGREICVGY